MRPPDDFDEVRLHFAAQDGDAAEVARLLAEGRSVDAFDELGKTPLHYAAMAAHLEVMRLLISAGANVNAHDEASIGDTPLGEVAGDCSYDVAKLLIDAGADPTIPGWMQMTALDRAKERKRPEGKRVLELLTNAARNPRGDSIGRRSGR